MEQQIAAFLGKIVLAGGGGALVAFGIFRFLGASWLESQFQKRLEAFRHENAKELEILRAKVDGELNATISSQEKERVILGDTWRAMNIAFGAVSRFVSTAQFVPSIEGLSGDELNEFLAKFEFSPATRLCCTNPVRDSSGSVAQIR